MSDEEVDREEWLLERAGILEFEAGLDRAQADRLALLMWREREGV